MRVVVDLWATAYRFPAGHRIGLHVTSSSFPRWARNTNTGEPMLSGTGTRVARQRVHVGDRYPSRLRSGRMSV